MFIPYTDGIDPPDRPMGRLEQHSLCHSGRRYH